jgi:hypothetical protein
MKSFITLATTLLVTACAPWAAPCFASGSTQQDTYRMLGEPTMRWPEADGGESRVYPTGPMGYKTWMARTDAAGRLLSIGSTLSTRFRSMSTTSKRSRSIRSGR